jgi:hypothetical protein
MTDTMNWRFFAASLALACVCYAAEKSHEHEHEGEEHPGHVHGGPLFTGETAVSVGLTAGGTVLVGLTLLAILWKPIDAAFRRSRFRSRWERRATRVCFAVVTLILASGIVGGVTYYGVSGGQHSVRGEDQLRPLHGGQVTTSDRFALEMVARRTGELRLYITPLAGETPTSWDIKGEVSIPQSAIGASGSTATNQVLPIKVNYDGSYFGAYTLPFTVRSLPVHLSLRIKEHGIDLDFRLPVED